MTEKSKTGKACPSCGQLGVSCKDSRPSASTEVFWRRTYQCSDCGCRFTTHEFVISTDGEGAITPAIRARMFVEGVERLMREILLEEGSNRRSTSALISKGDERIRSARVVKK